MLKNSIAVDTQPSTEGEFLKQQLEDRRREWVTDRLASRLGRPNRKFIDDIMQRVREIPDEALDATEWQQPKSPEPKRQGFDRLPGKLYAYILRMFPRESRGEQVWNRIREFVYPHFDEDLMQHLPYRSFLRLLIRFRAFDASPASLLTDARGLRSYLEYVRDDTSVIARGARGELTRGEINRIHLKVEDLIDTLQLAEQKSASREPPASGPPSPGSGGPRRY
jgi:hypothetical protein